MYQCDKCEYKAKHKSYLKKHMVNHQDPAEVIRYQCGKCDYMTKHKPNLLKHMVVHQDPSEVTTYRCDKCEYKGKHKTNLKKHMMIHQDPSESSCLSKKDVCSFDSEKDDVKSFTPIKEECQSNDNVCHLCKSSLSHDSYTSLADDNNDVNLRVLLDTYFPELNHNGIQDLLLCMECRVSLEAFFDAVSNWSNVQVNVRGNETVPHIVTKYCPDLNNTPQFQPKLEHNNISFDTENVFFEHEFKFSDCLLPTETSGFAKLERPEFSIKHEETDLKIGLDHYKSLEEYTIYPSQLEEIKKTGRTMCQQDFSDIPNVHKTIQGVTIFTCKICGFKTRVKWKFERHMVTHLYPSEETVYRCDKCEYKTKHNKSTLKRHMLIHQDPSEVTMFVCDRCEYKTKNKVNLRTAHSDSPGPFRVRYVSLRQM
ncbi:hypothetical protein NQ318_001847 [Aromia moschata]|uniref:Protein hunchback n=1 Tax=Aromia moschata TaxID=1265417 RepID=A0AAV8Z115_9CUCU|nr:hypothetical protein NQ318_001847 [Aromia moschata]